MSSFLAKQFNISRGVSNLVRYYSSKMCEKTALVLLSEGTEEMEFVISVDVLRRAGIGVTAAGVQGTEVVECSRQVKIAPDLSLEKAIEKKKYDAVVLPGGRKGAEEFCKSEIVGKLLKEQEESGRMIAAICAAPLALKAHKVCLGKNLTSHPSVEEELKEEKQYTYLQDKVVIDGNLITSRGPGTAYDFALAIAGQLCGNATSGFLSHDLLLTPYK